MKFRLEKRKWAVTVALLVIGLILIAIGIDKKQEKSVMAKAVRICMECVGIG
ncbi:MAG: hypothetical protein KBT07_06475 [Clostridiales bacterium]|nr:hypothetical protein [Candidatus Scatonaster coprocaballi]